MTFTAADHVTEREVGSRWEDCTIAAFLEILRLALPNGRALIPPTIAEVNRFRAAMGLPDNHPGVTIEDCIPTAKRLYGLTDEQYTLIREWATLAAALEDPRAVAVVTGLMGAVPVSYRRWDDFTGAHAVAKHGNLVFCDPLAPVGTDYTGDVMPLATWRAFTSGLSGWQALIMEVTGGQGMIAAGGIVITSSKQARITTAGPIFRDPGGEQIAVAQVGYKYPYLGNVPGHRAILVNTAKPYPDGVSRPTVLFILSAIAIIEDTPVIPVVPGTTDTGPAVQSKWSLWVETHP